MFSLKFVALLSLLSLLSVICPYDGKADTVTFTLDNLLFDTGQQMHGEFTWTYSPGDFENGSGVFTSISIPYTTHGVEDLIITIETEQIETSLDGNFHDDGVDIKLSLLEPFSLNGPANLDLDPAASNYSIGGNGFHDGHFIAGSIRVANSPLLGDVNRDGVVNLLDVAPFVELLSSGTFQLEADTNQDGVINLLDISPFIETLSEG